MSATQLRDIIQPKHGYANRGNWFNCAMMFRWEGPENDVWVKERIREFGRKARAIDAQVALTSGKKVMGKNSICKCSLARYDSRRCFPGRFSKADRDQEEVRSE